jgi:hypothetical protein
MVIHSSYDLVLFSVIFWYSYGSLVSRPPDRVIRAGKVRKGPA